MKSIAKARNGVDSTAVFLQWLYSPHKAVHTKHAMFLQASLDLQGPSATLKYLPRFPLFFLVDF